MQQRFASDWTKDAEYPAEKRLARSARGFSLARLTYGKRAWSFNLGNALTDLLSVMAKFANIQLGDHIYPTVFRSNSISDIVALPIPAVVPITDSKAHEPLLRSSETLKL